MNKKKASFICFLVWFTGIILLKVDDPDTEQLVKALRSLSFKYREVLVLYYYEEYNTSEIAKLLNVSVNTVKSRLRRGKEKLADILKED